MTQAPFHDGRRTTAILSPLLVVLGLLLFGLPQGHADGMATNAGPAAQSKVEQAQGILSVQRHLLRAQLPDDNSPGAIVPGVAVEAAHLFPVGILPAPHPLFVPVAIRILPPVRGPPAA